MIFMKSDQSFFFFFSRITTSQPFANRSTCHCPIVDSSKFLQPGATMVPLVGRFRWTALLALFISLPLESSAACKTALGNWWQSPINYNSSVYGGLFNPTGAVSTDYNVILSRRHLTIYKRDCDATVLVNQRPVSTLDGRRAWCIYGLFSCNR